MSTALRPRKLSSQSQEEERIEYVEIKKNSEIKKILKAEEEAGKKPEPAEQSGNDSKKENGDKKAKDKKFAFIKDDREREYPKVKEEAKKETSGKNEQEDGRKNNAKTGKQAYKLDEEKYPAEKQENAKERKQYRQKNSEEEPQKKVKYVQKEKAKEQPQSNPKNSKHHDHHSKPLSQIQTKKGAEIEVQLLQLEQLDQNQIFVQQKSVEQYLAICRNLLKEYEFIAIKAYGNLVSKAFLIAGLLADEFSQLKQINFPRVVKVKQIGKEQKHRTRGFITIQLSLQYLNKKNIGYQDSTTRLVPKNQKKPRKEYQSQKFKEKLIDERELR